MAGTGRQAELPQFTGLRGIAALLVLFFHVRTPQGVELTFGWVDPLSKFGYIGVDVFFVLSGFILTHVYGHAFSSDISRAALYKYWVSRFARIYPLHFVTLLMMLLAYAVAVHLGVSPTETEGYSLASTILSMLLVNEWVGVVAPNPSSWSISIEFASYLIFPFLVPTVFAARRYSLLMLIALAAAIAFTEWRLLRSMLEFMMGCFAYSATISQPNTKLPGLSGLAFALPFCVAGYFGDEIAWFSALSFALGLVFLASAKWDLFRLLCSSQPIRFLGEISYSVYLMQWFIWIGWKHVLAKTSVFAPHPYVMAACASISVLICATLSYYWIETPARNWLRQRAFSPCETLGCGAR